MYISFHYPIFPITINLDLKNAVINYKDEASTEIIATAKGGLDNYAYTLLNNQETTIVRSPI
jgi:hypothetical protein